MDWDRVSLYTSSWPQICDHCLMSDGFTGLCHQIHLLMFLSLRSSPSYSCCDMFHFSLLWCLVGTWKNSNWWIQYGGAASTHDLTYSHIKSGFSFFKLYLLLPPSFSCLSTVMCFLITFYGTLSSGSPIILPSRTNVLIPLDTRSMVDNDFHSCP